MAAVTVTDLIARARSAADVRDNFVTTTEWLAWLNVERMKLESMLARSGYALREGREDYDVDDGDINAFGEATLTEPIAIMGVYHLDNGYYRRLTHSDLMDGADKHDFGATTGDATEFRVVHNNNGTVTLKFWPVPTTGTYQVFLIDSPAALTTASSVNYPMSWEEYIVLGVAKRALMKMETVNPALNAEHDDITRHIEFSAWDRLMGAHKAVRNVDKVERGWSRQPRHGDHRTWLFF